MPSASIVGSTSNTPEPRKPSRLRPTGMTLSHGNLLTQAVRWVGGQLVELVGVEVGERQRLQVGDDLLDAQTLAQDDRDAVRPAVCPAGPVSCATSRGVIVRASSWTPASSRLIAATGDEQPGERHRSVTQAARHELVGDVRRAGALVDVNSTTVGSVPAGVSGRLPIVAPTASAMGPMRIRSGLASARRAKDVARRAAARRRRRPRDG